MITASVYPVGQSQRLETVTPGYSVEAVYSGCSQLKLLELTCNNRFHFMFRHCPIMGFVCSVGFPSARLAAIRCNMFTTYLDFFFFFLNYCLFIYFFLYFPRGASKACYVRACAGLLLAR